MWIQIFTSPTLVVIPWLKNLVFISILIQKWKARGPYGFEGEELSQPFIHCWISKGNKLDGEYEKLRLEFELE